MGYTTEFKGQFDINMKVTDEFKNYINKFSRTRHMMRDNKKLKELYPDWSNQSFHGKLGTMGEYFIANDGFFGQTRDDSILDFNTPAPTQPGLWCQWIITDDNSHLKWDECEKFYYYVEWLDYLINNFFAPEGYILNGEVSWQGEYEDDKGIIKVINNEISLVIDED